MGKSLLNPIILCVTLLNNLLGREKMLRPHTWLKGRVCGRNACVYNICIYKNRC